jgi:hypothetical protein
MMPIRWHFLESYEGESVAARWVWRVMRVDGTIESHSRHFPTYGMAVIDAIKSGFQPRRQPWLVATRNTITHYRPGQPPMTVPITDEATIPDALKQAAEKGNARDEASEDVDSPEPRVRRE